ncbi:MAG: alpha/beta hydrolase [Gemmatimonadota bacterium]
MSSRRDSAPLLRAVGVAAVLCGALLLAGVVFPGLLARHVVPIFLYLPGPAGTVSGDPVDHGLSSGEDVVLTTSDGVRIRAWWVPASADASCGAAVYFHGNAGSLAGRAFIARRLAASGFDVFLVEYRGYGRSEGRPHEKGLYRDASAALRHVLEERGTPPARVVVAGHSLGSAVAAHLASRERVGAAVLTRAFPSVPKLAARIYGWLPDALFRGWPTQRFETERWAREIAAPVLVARGEADRLVPRDQSRRVHQAAGPGAAWLEVPGAGHDDLWVADTFWARLVPFLEGSLACR